MDLPSPPPPLPPPKRLARASGQMKSVPAIPLVRFKPGEKIRSKRSLVTVNSNAYSTPFQPGYMFFYGSLMDPEVIKSVVKLTGLLTTKPAAVSGFKIKM